MRFLSRKHLRNAIASAHQLLTSNLLTQSPRQSRSRSCNGSWRYRAILSNSFVRQQQILPFTEESADIGDSQSVIIGLYVILFGAGEP